MLTACLAAVAVFVSVVTIYLVTEHALRDQVNDRLNQNTDAIIASATYRAPLALFGLSGPRSSEMAVITQAGQLITASSEKAPFNDEDALLNGPEMAVAQGHASVSLRELKGYQLLAKKMPTGDTLVVAESLAPSSVLLNKLLLALTSLGAILIIFSVVAGSAAINAGLRPVRRLTLATRRVAETNDLQPIPVTGNDELARFGHSFNEMLESVTRSRDHQRALIVDAGHELLTPLTALRTNLELLIMASDRRGPQLSDADRDALSIDVIQQIEELSHRVGALVDRARQDDTEPPASVCGGWPRAG